MIPRTARLTRAPTVRDMLGIDRDFRIENWILTVYRAHMSRSLANVQYGNYRAKRCSRFARFSALAVLRLEYYEVGLGAQIDVGAEFFQKLCRLRPWLDAKHLLNTLCDPVRRSSLKVLGVDVGAVFHQVLEHFVQTTKGGSVQSRKFRLVYGIHLCSGLHEHLHRCFCGGRARTSLRTWLVARTAESGRNHQRGRVISGREIGVGSSLQEHAN